MRSLPPANTGAAEFSEFPLPVKAAYLFGAIKDAAEKIDHTAPPPAAVAEELLARGQYIAQGCTGCHGAVLGREDSRRATGVADCGESHLCV